MASGPHERDSRHNAGDESTSREEETLERPASPPTLHHAPPGPAEDRPQAARMASPWALPPFGAPVPEDEDARVEEDAPAAEADPPTWRRPYSVPYNASEPHHDVGSEQRSERDRRQSERARRMVDRPDKLVASGPPPAKPASPPAEPRGRHAPSPSASSAGESEARHAPYSAASTPPEPGTAAYPAVMPPEPSGGRGPSPAPEPGAAPYPPVSQARESSDGHTPYPPMSPPPKSSRMARHAPYPPVSSPVESVAGGIRTGPEIPAEPERMPPPGRGRDQAHRPVREPVHEPAHEPLPEPVERIGRPPGGRPAQPDVLVALGPPRAVGGRHHRRAMPGRVQVGRLLTPALVVAALLVATGLGALVFRWVSDPSTTGLRLAAGDGQAGDAAFAAPGLPGNGSSQVLNAITSVGTTVVAVGSDTTSPVPRPLFLVSTDGGRNWKLGRVAGPTGYEPAAGAVGRVVGGGGRWLAVGTDAPGSAGPAARGMWISSDGRTWTAVDPARLTVFWSQDKITDLARTSDGFVAVGTTTLRDGTLGPVAWASDDGQSWSRVDAAQIGTPDKVRGMRAVAARGDQVVALADPGEGDSTSVILRSPDGGRTWSRTAAALADVRPEPGALAVAKDGFLLVPTRQTSSDGEVRVYCSPEGAQWNQCGVIGQLSAQGAGVRGLASSAAGIAAVTESSWERYAVYTSTDGHKWTKSADLGEIPGTLRGLTITDDGLLVAGGDKRGPGDVENLPVLMTAEKGRSAEAVPLETIAGLNRLARDTTGVAASGGTFVAVGSANGDAGIWTSGNNGANWKAAVFPDLLGGSGRQALSDVVHGPKGWLAVGSTMTDPAVTRPLLVTSPDAKSWRPGPAIEVASGHFLLAPRVVTAGPKGYVLAGEDRSATGVLPALWFSPDLKRFTRSAPGSMPAGGAGVGISDVTATPSGFMAVGGSGTADRETGVVWVSPDGLNWTAKGRVLPEDARSAGLRHVTTTGSRVVAIGVAQTADGAMPFSAVSTDNGSHWEYEWLPADGAATVLGLTATGQGLVAVGSDGTPGEGESAAWTSEDGLNWTRHTLAEDGLGGSGAQWLDAVAVSGDRVIALGRSTTYAEDHLTIWRSTISR